MEYFSRFLRAGAPQLPKSSYDHAQEFNRSWQLIKNTLQFPDERQLTKGIMATDVPAHLKLIVDSLVWESTRTEEGTTGQCLEYLLKNDVLGNLVRLSEADRPFGIQAQVLRSVANMVILLNEQFLVHSAVHKAVLRLLRNCVGDQIEEQVDGKAKPMGAASNVARGAPSEYEEDLVDLLCILCSRIRNYRELLMIFFHDKHWFQSDLQTVPEEEEEDDDDDSIELASQRAPSPSTSQHTITSAHTQSAPKKTEYEFLLFNYLLRFVHREGRIGDFARAGLLFLMDVAMSAGEPTQHKLLEEDNAMPASPTVDASATDPVADAALALAEYVLDGDFSEVLGAGLGAVYSLLPSKLVVSPDITSHSGDAVMRLGAAVPGSEEEKQRIESERERNLALGLESSATPEFKSRLNHFLKLLEFLQDVLRRNESSDPHSQLMPSALVGTAIVQSILDAVRSVFLENILYTSILECSDTDGSAVAVMSYIDIMIRTLAGSQLGDLLVNFLMSEDDHDSRRPHPRLLSLDRGKKERERVKKTRRKSSAMVLLEMEAPDSRKQSDYFTSIGRFTLKDLIFSNLRSPYQPSVTAALQLLRSLLKHHPAVCVDKLLVTIHDPAATSFPQPLRVVEPEFPSRSSPESDDEDVFVYPGEDGPTIPALKFSSIFKEPDMTFVIHELEMDMYFSLIKSIGSAQDHSSFSTGYGHYLDDALCAIQSQSVFRDNMMTERPASSFSMHHRLDPNDPLLGLVLKSLQGFFSRGPECNIALTGVMAALASDPYRSLAGWLTFNIPQSEKMNSKVSSTYDNIRDDGDDRSVDFDVRGKPIGDDIDLIAMPLNESLRPVLYSVLLGLVTQLDRYRAQVANFDKYLTERRQGLLFSENLNDALSLVLDPVSDKPTPVSPTHSIPVTGSKQASMSSSFVSFLTPKKKATNTSSIATSVKPSTPSHRNVAASPFGPHYQETGSIAVQPIVAPLPASGPWSPARKPVWSMADEDDDVFTASIKWGGESGRYTEPKEGMTAMATKVTLSQLLDNVVILEESIKELMAIIQARRSLGIDTLRYM